MIKKPYLLFLGDAKDMLAIKTAKGIMDWRAQWVVGQLRLDECAVSLGSSVAELSLAEAYEKGARTLVIGVVNPGGVLPEKWLPVLQQAIGMGYDIASGMHQRLAEIPEIAEAVRSQKNVSLFDLRFSDRKFETGKGVKRSGKRILTVGTDCSVGKKYTSLAIDIELRKRGCKSVFYATGHTGILIAESGIAIDAVISDFIAGAAEALSPESDEEHWACIEGQGSLFHPSYAGVTLGLLHGSQPDFFVVCHEPTRKTMRNVNMLIPKITDVIDQTTALGSLTNKNIKCAGLSINTSALNETQARDMLSDFTRQYGLPCCDPIRFGCKEIVEQLLTSNNF